MGSGILIGCCLVWFLGGLAQAVGDFYHPPTSRERAARMLIDIALYAPFVAAAFWAFLMSRTTASRLRERYAVTGEVGSRWIRLVNTINLFLWIPLVPILLLIPIALLAFGR